MLCSAPSCVVLSHIWEAAFSVSLGLLLSSVPGCSGGDLSPPRILTKTQQVKEVSLSPL